MVFEGTYDALQREVLTRRTREFDAALFGSLLSPQAWEKVPEAIRPKLRDAAPNFDPGRPR